MNPDKREVRIIDYVDSLVPMLRRMFERRCVGYHAMGYSEHEIEGFIEVASRLRLRSTTARRKSRWKAAPQMRAFRLFPVALHGYHLPTSEISASNI
jgi:hypothetical protein